MEMIVFVGVWTKGCRMGLIPCVALPLSANMPIMCLFVILCFGLLCFQPPSVLVSGILLFAGFPFFLNSLIAFSLPLVDISNREDSSSMVILGFAVISDRIFSVLFSVLTL